MNNQKNKLIIFQSKQIRLIWHEDQWHFSVVDVCGALTDSSDYQQARKYWNKLSQRLREEGSEVVTICHRLKLEAYDRKMRNTDCANTEGIFRIIQSIPSPKAEPFKRWLAKVGYERVEEQECVFIDNHEKNLKVPKKIGFKTYLFDPAKNDTKKLKKYMQRLNLKDQ